MGSADWRRSKRPTISRTHRSSSALEMRAGIDTCSTPPTRRACTVLRRLALRTTSTCIAISRRRYPSLRLRRGDVLALERQQRVAGHDGPAVAHLEPPAAEVG